jgi:CDP-4-dehydro-6-deoxyglucose reductase/ferredoxin-NAD(P)+ reductase (naphthalene dioxygenase ferredoxin-specific)
MKWTVTIVDAGTALRVPEDETLLSTALAAGLPYPHNCQAGRCGACKSRLLAGQVELLPRSRFALSDDERGQGLILACRAMPRSDLVVTWQSGTQATPEVRYGHATVVAKHEIAPSILRLVLRSKVGTFDFLPGQYFELGFPGAPLRSFSPANQPGGDQVEFHIRVLPGGSASAVLSGHVAPADMVAINGPYGDAYLRETHQGPLLLLAASSGLAPIKSILDRSLDATPDRPTHVYVSARSLEEGYLWGYLERLATQRSNLQFKSVVTRDENGRPTGRRLPEVLHQDFGGGDLTGWEVHAAGPEPFVEAMRSAATHLSAADVYADPFVVALPASTPNRHSF